MNALNEKIREVVQVVGFCTQLHSSFFSMHTLFKFNLVLDSENLIVTFTSELRIVLFDFAGHFILTLACSHQVEHVLLDQ